VPSWPKRVVEFDSGPRAVRGRSEVVERSEPRIDEGASGGEQVEEVRAVAPDEVIDDAGGLPLHGDAQRREFSPLTSGGRGASAAHAQQRAFAGRGVLTTLALPHEWGRVQKYLL
jgi:hypothetical protein